MTTHFGAIAQKVSASGTIEEADILALRRAGWRDATITQDEAQTIFAINRALVEPPPAWCAFFTEAIAHYLVETIEPRGYLDEANARWLVDAIELDQALCPETELAVVVRVFETAQSTPESLRVWALERLERAIRDGTGLARRGPQVEKGTITREDTAILRRILFASGSERPAGVSRREAELLYRLKDATLGAANAPEWKALFVQGVANYLQGFTRHTPVSPARAAELDRYMNDHATSVAGFLGKTARAMLHPNRAGKVFGRKPARPDVNALVEAATEVTGEEQIWLDERIEANGAVDDYDQALLRFLAEG